MAIAESFVCGVVAGAASGAASQLSREVVKRNADSIAQVTDNFMEFTLAKKDAFEHMVSEGWRRDYDAGGISSWNSQKMQKFNPA